MGEIVLLLDELERASCSTIPPYCRICHETEFESSKSLESPCACSGTIEYAHRDCIQRWCDEKGNTVCEICLQKFESGYTAVPKVSHGLLLGTTTINVMSIRESLQVPRRGGIGEGEEIHENGRVVIDENGTHQQLIIQNNSTEVQSSACRGANFWRFMALLMTMILLTKNTFGVVMGRTEDYPFSLVTVVIIKASGIIVPMYAFVRLITAVHNSIKHQTTQL